MGREAWRRCERRLNPSRHQYSLDQERSDRERTFENDNTTLANEVERDIKHSGREISRKWKIVEERRRLREIEESGSEGMLDREIPCNDRLEPDLQELVWIALGKSSNSDQRRSHAGPHRLTVNTLASYLSTCSEKKRPMSLLPSGSPIRFQHSFPYRKYGVKSCARSQSLITR